MRLIIFILAVCAIALYVFGVNRLMEGYESRVCKRYHVTVSVMQIGGSYVPMTDKNCDEYEE